MTRRVRRGELAAGYWVWMLSFLVVGWGLIGEPDTRIDWDNLPDDPSG